MSEIDQLLRHLKDRSPLLGKGRRKKAIEKLSQIGTAEVVPHLITALSSEEEEIKKEAYRGLSLLTDPEAIEALCSFYLENRNRKLWEIISRKNFSPKDPLKKIKFYISTGQTGRCIPPDEEEIPHLIKLLDSSETLFLNEAQRIISTLTEDRLKDLVFHLYFKNPTPVLQNLLVKQGWLPTEESKRSIFFLLTERIEDGLRIERRMPGIIISGYKNLERRTKEMLLDLLVRNRSLHPLLSKIINIEREREIKKGIAILLIEKGEGEGFQEAIKGFSDDIIREIIQEKEIDPKTLLEIGIAKGGLLLCTINSLLVSRGFEVSDFMKGVLEVEKELVEVNIEAKDKGTEDERREAINILGQIEDKRATESLLSTLEDPNRRLQLSGLSVIARRRPKSLLEAVSALFARSDWRKRVLLAPLVQRLAEKDVSDFLVKALSQTDLELQEEAVRVLAKLQSKKAVEPLIVALRHGKTRIRRIAASALGKLGDAQAIKPLIRTLQDRDRIVRICAAYSLGRIANEGLFDELRLEFEKRPWYVKEAGLRAFFRTKEDKAVDYLVETALKDPEKEVRKTAISLLGKLRQERTKEPLVKMLGDKNREVRLMISLALCKLGEDRGIGYLVDILMSKDWRSQMMAAYGLSLVASPETIQRIGELMKVNDSKVREAAAIAIGKTRDERSVPLLISAWGGETDIEVKKRIVEGLGRIGSPKSLSLLELAISEKEAEVREKAAAAIGMIGRKEGLVPLMKALKDEDFRVRSRVLKALRSILSKSGQDLSKKELDFIKKRASEMKKERFLEMNEWLLLKLQFLILEYQRKDLDK